MNDPASLFVLVAGVAVGLILGFLFGVLWIGVRYGERTEYWKSRAVQAEGLLERLESSGDDE